MLVSETPHTWHWGSKPLTDLIERNRHFLPLNPIYLLVFITAHPELQP